MILELTLDRFEGDHAILKTKDNVSINWPKEKLPPKQEKGMILKFSIFENGADYEEKKQAKEILNELLKINHS